jgi:hypothetical protein
MGLCIVCSLISNVLYILTPRHAGFEYQNIEQVDCSGDDGQEDQCEDLCAKGNNLLESDDHCCTACPGESNPLPKPPDHRESGG